MLLKTGKTKKRGERAAVLWMEFQCCILFARLRNIIKFWHPVHYCRSSWKLLESPVISSNQTCLSYHLSHPKYTINLLVCIRICYLSKLEVITNNVCNFDYHIIIFRWIFYILLKYPCEVFLQNWKVK